MFKNISTTEFILAILILVVAYYLVVLIIFYRDTIKQLLSRQRPDKMKP